MYILNSLARPGSVVQSGTQSPYAFDGPFIHLKRRLELAQDAQFVQPPQRPLRLRFIEDQVQLMVDALPTHPVEQIQSVV